MTARFSIDDYTMAFRALLPRGRAWSRSPDSTIGQLTDALAAMPEQVDADAQQLLIDAFPTTTTALISEWDSSLGIPDPCSGPPATLVDNRAQIVARLASTGGQSVPYLLQVINAFGFVASITEYSAAAPGVWAPNGVIKKTADWHHTFSVDLTPASVSLLTVTSDVTQPLGALNLQALDCILQRIKPAHTQYFYRFISPVARRRMTVVDAVLSSLIITTG